MIQHAFTIMASIWPRPKRQELYDHIIAKAFPDASGQWQADDLTTRTRDGQPCHTLQVRIQDAPSSWFCNLKMLQLRQNLGLDCILAHRFTDGRMVMGEMYAKMQTLEQVVGKTMVEKYKMPLLKRPLAVSKRY